MSLFDKVKKAAKQAGKKAAKEIEKYAAEVQLQREKAELLGLLKKKELIDLAFNYDVRVSKGMTKDDIASALSKRKRLTKRKIQNVIRKRKGIETVSTEELEVERVEEEIVKTRRVKTKIRKVSTIEKKIERELNRYTPISKLKSERDLERELTGGLARAFGRENVRTQVRLRYGKVDVVIREDYAIELKMPSSVSELIRAEGPIRRYAKDFKKVYLYIYDKRKVLRPAERRELQKDLPSNVRLILKG